MRTFFSDIYSNKRRFLPHARKKFKGIRRTYSGKKNVRVVTQSLSGAGIGFQVVSATKSDQLAGQERSAFSDVDLVYDSGCLIGF